MDWNIRGDASGQEHGAGLEHQGKNVLAGNRATRARTSGGQKPGTGAAGEEGRRRRPGKERPGLSKEEEAAAANKAGGQ